MAPSDIYCTKCGTANQAQDAFCFACGHPLRTTSSSMYYPTVSSASTTLTGLLTFNHLLKQRYRILEQLGKGGFGAVYKAEDTQFGNRLVAVKEMSQRELKTQQEITEATHAFKREALMLAGLRHQNLPRIYDHFLDGGQWYLVMDYIEGETLSDRLNRVGGHLLLEEALQIGIQLCTVLGYLHTRQPPIIFRDLTPNNIMLTPDGHLYLIDFGIARLFKPGQTKDTTEFGTLGYAAPELLSKQTTPQSDIYSLGAILHQMLTGMDPAQKPFRFAPPQLSGNPALMQLSTLVMQMLDMDEARRPASMTAVKQELQQITDQLAGKRPLPPTQPVGGTLPSLTQGFRGRKRIFSIAAGVVVLVVMVAVLIPRLLNNHLQSSPQSASSSSSNTPAPALTTVATSAPTPTATPIPPTPTPTPTPTHTLSTYTETPLSDGRPEAWQSAPHAHWIQSRWIENGQWTSWVASTYPPSDAGVIGLSAYTQQGITYLNVWLDDGSCWQYHKLSTSSFDGWTSFYRC